MLTGPIESERKPQISLPTAEEKLNPATRPAPSEAERPTELLYSGRKNGGTKRGKVPIAPAIKSTVNFMSLNRLLDYNLH